MHLMPGIWINIDNVLEWITLLERLELNNQMLKVTLTILDAIS